MTPSLHCSFSTGNPTMWPNSIWTVGQRTFAGWVLTAYLPPLQTSVDCFVLVLLMFFCPQWLHGTILRRVVDEIALANAKILKLSDDAALIGCELLTSLLLRLVLFTCSFFCLRLATTLNTLEQLAKGRYQHIATLSTLIRFLELTKEQNYLVFRLQGWGFNTLDFNAFTLEWGL